MLLESGIIASLGVIVVATFVYLRRAVGGAGAQWWAWAWVSVWASGLLASFDQRSLLAATAGAFIGSFFMFFTLAGALRFAGRAVPRGLLSAALAFAVVRGALRGAGEPMAAFGLSIPVELGVGLAAAAVLLRSPAPGPARFLPWALLLLTGIDVADLVLRATGTDPLPTILAWIVGGFTVALLQILALVERVRADEARARAELARERSTLRAILETAPVGIVLGADDGTIQMVNRLAPAHWGFDGADVMRGRTARELAGRIAPRMEDAEAFLAEVRRAQADPYALIEDAEFRFLPPEDRTIDLFSSAVVDDSEGDGRRVGRIYVTRDVTVERRLEEQLRQAQKMETLGTLAGGIAHDFNNQLTAILGNARLARECSPGDPEEARRALTDLERAAEHCAALTQGLLSFARRAPVQLRPVAAEETVAEVARLLRPGLPPGVRLSVETEPGLPPVRADATQLQQALLNLAVNARDAVGPGGRIRIRARVLDAGRGDGVPPGAAAEPLVEFCVEDDGAGMDAWTLRRVFDPFFTTKPVGRGTGLGLAIVYGVARAHGGFVDVDSQPGAGTRFRLGLPVSADAPVARPAEAPGAPAPGAGGTILLAEDDERVRRLARRTLEREGYRVVEARDGDDAVEAFLRDPCAVDALVCDLSMPGRSGTETIAAIRREVPELPAVLVSGHFEAAGPGDAAGVVRLAKPYAPSSLLAHLRRAMDEVGRDGPGSAPPEKTAPT